MLLSEIYDIIFFLLSVFLIIGIIYINIPSSNKIYASDQSYHKLIIHFIKKNNHKFITRIPCFLFYPQAGYPQLLHWFLSFFKKETTVDNFSKYLPLINNIILFILHLLFTIIIYPYLNISIPLKGILFVSGIIYLSNVIIFNQNNAKNSGLSARGLGIIFCQLYIYSLILNYYSNNHYLYVISILFIFFTIITSQFGTQFIIFSTPVFFIIFKDILIIFLPLFSIILFILLFPKFSKIYFITQWKHKKWYALIGQKYFILQSRESIWLDFFYGFWKRFKKNGIKNGLFYFFYNPVIIIIFGIPQLIPCIISFFYNQYFKTLNSVSLFYCCIAGLILFILTSFRKTRFLGEPERYMEFILSPLSLFSAVIYYNCINILVFILLISLLRLILEYFISTKKQNYLIEKFWQIQDIVYKLINKKQLRFLSNNLNITKLFFHPNIKVYWGHPIYNESEFKEIFENYPIIKNNIIPLIIEQYNINIILIDKKEMPNPFNKYINREKWLIHYENKYCILLERI